MQALSNQTRRLSRTVRLKGRDINRPGDSPATVTYSQSYFSEAPVKIQFTAKFTKRLELRPRALFMVSWHQRLVIVHKLSVSSRVTFLQFLWLQQIWESFSLPISVQYEDWQHFSLWFDTSHCQVLSKATDGENEKRSILSTEYTADTSCVRKVHSFNM